MKRVELEVEHSYDNKFVGKHRLKQVNGLTVLGASRSAHIRLLGEEISEIHAYLEYTNGHWYMMDAGSDAGTWIKKKPIVSQQVSNPFIATIGKHSLRVTPKLIESDLFKTDNTSKKSVGDKKYHQIVIRKKGFVLDSYLLDEHEAFVYRHGGKDHELKSPKEMQWKVTEFDEVQVQQRIVLSKVVETQIEDKMRNPIEESLKIPFLMAFVLFLGLSGLFLLNPDAPELAEVKKMDLQKNRYTRMIVDAKSMRKKRAEAMKIRDNFKSPTKSTAQPTSSRVVSKNNSQPKAGKAPRIVSKLKSSGLSKLLGKISKRAAKNSVLVKSKGRLAGSGPTGRAFTTTATVSGKTRKIAAAGSSYKVSNVGTLGKGKGGKIKGIGGLRLGGVGTSNVGILEEETEVEGGLERDVIARVIESHLGQIRYCYERQLSANPDMYGKVVVNFKIGAAGGVSAQTVGLSTLKSAMVEGCILRRIAGWRFPKPKGGTSVFVKYPFLFKSSN